MTRIKVLVSGRSVSYSGDPHAIKAALITARIPPDRVRFIAPALATEITVTPRDERILPAAGGRDPDAGPALPAERLCGRLMGRLRDEFRHAMANWLADHEGASRGDEIEFRWGVARRYYEDHEAEFAPLLTALGRAPSQVIDTLAESA